MKNAPDWVYALYAFGAAAGAGAAWVYARLPARRKDAERIEAAIRDSEEKRQEGDRLLHERLDRIEGAQRESQGRLHERIDACLEAQSELKGELRELKGEVRAMQRREE